MDRPEHGMCRTPEYRAWANMLDRCRNSNSPGYHRYGGRGITVCPSWQESFLAFFSYMGERPSPKHSIDRIDNDGNYEPDNVRWATRKEQQQNTRSNRVITFQGKTMCASEWARALGISISVVLHRLAKGMKADRALIQPVRVHPSDLKYVTQQDGRSIVNVRRQYLGSFSTVEEAIAARDEYVALLQDGDLQKLSEFCNQSRKRSWGSLLTHNGETLTVRQWSRRTGLPENTIRSRLRNGLSIGRVLSPTKNPHSFTSGVSFHKSRRKWQAYGPGRKPSHLGLFATKEEAVAVAQACRITPDRMPAPRMPVGETSSLFGMEVA